MALDTICQLCDRNILFNVFFLNPGWLMLVAAITGVGDIAAGVTGFTFDQSLTTMIEGKGMVAQLGRMPGLGGVAALAFQAKETGMYFWLGMAGNTGIRSA